MSLTDCACGSQRPYPECCGAFHAGLRKAATAEELMRSRYSAYALKLPDYIVATTHPSYRSPGLMQEVEAWMAQTTWQQLEVLQTKQGGTEDQQGEVEFRAHYSVAGINDSHHEHSRFEKQEDEWYYTEGVVEA